MTLPVHFFLSIYLGSIATCDFQVREYLWNLETKQRPLQKKKHNEKKTSLNRRKLEYSRVLFKSISSINQSIYQSIDQSSNQSINHYIISRTVSIYPFLSRHSIFDKYTPDISSHTSIHLNLTHYFYFFNTLFYLVKQSKSNHYRY